MLFQVFFGVAHPPAGAVSLIMVSSKKMISLQWRSLAAPVSEDCLRGLRSVVLRRVSLEAHQGNHHGSKRCSASHSQLAALRCQSVRIRSVLSQMWQKSYAVFPEMAVTKSAP